MLVTQLCPALEIPWTVAHQAPLSMEFSRQEYWSGLPFPSPEGLPDPGIEPGSPALEADSLSIEPPGKPLNLLEGLLNVGCPVLGVSESGSLGWSLGVCISKKFPGDAAATDLGTMLENP